MISHIIVGICVLLNLTYKREICNMNKQLIEMFLKHPDKEKEGIYFYNNEESTSIEENLEITGNDIQSKKENTSHYIKDNLLREWGKRSIFNTLNPDSQDNDFVEMIKNIANDNSPVLDIASSANMGMIPYIIQLNPSLPCLVTDADTIVIECLSSYCKEYLSEYNISFASFDNKLLPFKNNSFKYITSIDGLLSSKHLSKTDRITTGNGFACADESEGVIAEVYRVLKPGGKLLTYEYHNENRCDLSAIRDFCQRKGLVFGLFTYDEIKLVCEELKGKTWNEQLTSSEFQIVKEKRNVANNILTSAEIKRLLYNTTNTMGKQWREEEIALLYITDDVVGYIRKAKTLEEFRYNCGSFYQNYASLYGLAVIESNTVKFLSADEIIEIIWKHKDDDSFIEALNVIEKQHDEEFENFGFCIDSIRTFFVLEKI